MYRQTETESDLPAGATLPAETYHTVHEVNGVTPLSVGVIEAVAGALGLDPVSQRIPVDECIDLEALDNIFCGCSAGPACGTSRFVLSIWGLEVVIHDDGHIFVHPPSN